MTGIVNESIIEIDRMDFSYPSGRPIFENLSLTFKPGQFYLVRGASGAGKSTLLRLLIRLEEPTAGVIRFNGRGLTDFLPTQLRRRILYIQQTPTVVNGTIRDNLLLPFRFSANSDLPLPRDEALNGQLERFLLTDLGLQTDAKTLSVGQLQRLCLIRGLLLAPQVVLLDEPASALDATSRSVVEETAEQLCAADGLTVIMVSHRQFEPVALEPVIFELKAPGPKEGP